MMIRTSLALIPLMALVACGQAPQSGETKPAPEAAASKDSTPSVAPAAAPATPAPAAGPSPEDAKILAGLPAPYN
ncbi:MAG: hypothetical protein ACK5VS_11810, partial [Hyphomonadaceae bacterium]